MKLLFMLSMALLYLLPCQGQTSDSTEFTLKSKPRNTFEGIPGALNTLERSAEKLNDIFLDKLRGRDREEARHLLKRMGLSIDFLRAALFSPVHLPGMRPEDFNDLIRGLKNEHFDSDKKKMIGLFSISGRLSVNQAIDIINLFTMSAEKIETLRTLYPIVEDKENAYKLVNAFTFSSDKEEVVKIIKGEH